MARAPREQHKILFLAVNGADRDLRLDEEYRAIDSATGRRADSFTLASKWALQRDELQRGLLQHQPDVVHFGGHGTRTGELVLRDPDGGLVPVSADALGSLFGALRGNIQIVVLNACFSAIQAAAIRDSVGIAIGMRRQISDRASIAFTAAFYEALVYRQSVRSAFDLGVAAIRTQGCSEEADIPELLVRPGVDAASVYLVAVRAPASAPDDASNGPLATRRFAFVVLLLAALVLAVLFGTGVLRQDAVAEYVLFVVLGGVAAALTWGILSSTGELKGTSYGFDVKVTGSLLPLIVIVAGGLWLRTSEQEFSIKIKFLDDAGQPVRVTGSLRLEAEGATYPATSQSADLVEVTQLPHRLSNARARVTLDSAAFRISAPDQEYVLEPTRIVAVRVHPRTRLSGTVSFAGARLPGGRILVVGSNCGDDIRDGYFEILCDDLALPVQVEVQLPELYASQICERKRALTTFAKNELVLGGCPPPSPSPPPLPLEIITARSTANSDLDITFLNRNGDPVDLTEVVASIESDLGSSPLPVLKPEDVHCTLIFRNTKKGTTAACKSDLEIPPHKHTRALIRVRLRSAAKVRFVFHYDIDKIVSTDVSFTF